MDGPENGNFSLFYVVKMSLRRWVGGKLKMAPNPVSTRGADYAHHTTAPPLPQILERCAASEYSYSIS